MAAGQFGRAADEDGHAGRKDVAGRCQLRVQRERVQTLHGLGGIAVMARDAQPAGVHGGEDHALGAEGGQDLAGDERDEVLHGDDLGERGREVHQLVEPSGRCRCGPAHRRRRRLGGLLAPRQDTDADAAAVRVEPERQPLVRRPQRVEGCGRPADDDRAVLVLVDGVVQPRQGLPGAGAEQFPHRAAEQPGGRGAGEGDAALQVEGDGALGEAFEEVGRGCAGQQGVALGVDAQDPGQLGQVRRLGQVVQQPGELVRAGGEVAAFARRGGAGPFVGPHQYQAAPAAAGTGQGDRGEGEPVGQHGRGARIAARHLVVAGDPHHAVLADRLGERCGCGERKAPPRRGELLRHTADGHHAQHPLRLLGEEQTADRRAGAAHHARQRGPERLVQGAALMGTGPPHSASTDKQSEVVVELLDHRLPADGPSTPTRVDMSPISNMTHRPGVRSPCPTPVGRKMASVPASG